jgi:RNA polymerase sigma factor (TIGR02999 family)
MKQRAAATRTTRAFRSGPDAGLPTGDGGGLAALRRHAKIPRRRRAGALARVQGAGYCSGMSPDSHGSVTQLLHRWHAGDREALDRLLPLVYADLRRIAARQLRSNEGHATLQATALVNDVLLRLLDRPAASFESTAHLLNAAARMMRQQLVARSREAGSIKRGGGWRRDDLAAAMDLPIPDDTDLAELDRALDELEGFDARMARVVELRYFVGLSMAEVAASLGVVERTAQRDMASAQAWLRERLDG